jgi:hypothetical protein
MVRLLSLFKIVKCQMLLKGVRSLGCVPAGLLFLVDSEVICGLCDFLYNACLLTPL